LPGFRETLPIPGLGMKRVPRRKTEGPTEGPTPGHGSTLPVEPGRDARRSLLTILVEDYFHVGAFENLIQQRNWQNFEPRYEKNTLKILDLLDRYNTKATFFVLGWIADLNPDLVREIVARGHEVGSRGFYHRSPRYLTPDEFRDDLRRASHVIEDASGQRVAGYRAAEKLAFEQSDWVLDVLAQEGFAYDASFLPTAKTDVSQRFAHQVETEGGPIWEFPYTTVDLGVGLLPISGGNYFRQVPYTLMRRAVRKWHARHDDPFVFYFHVWELDPEQPRISAASNYNRIRHYRKLDKMEWILEENLALYKCTSIARHLGLAEQLKPAGTKAAVPTAAASAAPARAGRRKPVSIVVPCYNEEESIPYLANTLSAVGEDLRAIGFEPKLIFVDDRSEDRTLEVLEANFGGRSDVKILKHEVNRGVAAGIVTGIAAADTEIVCSIDCDCTFDPHELVRMVPLLTEGVDMVTASPYHRDGGVRNVPGWRLLLSKGASVIYRRILRTKIATYTSCFRVYRRSAMLDLKPTAPGFHGVAEMLGLLDLKGGRIVEFPTVLAVRLFGISKMKTAKTIAGHVKLMARLGSMRLFGRSAGSPSLTMPDLTAAQKDAAE
jgi:polysaccharide deacetylase family protein (PEP-CTERM system associated)